MESTRLDVLVVDDEPALREVLALRIADWGHDVRTVGDTIEAVMDAIGFSADEEADYA